MVSVQNKKNSSKSTNSLHFFCVVDPVSSQSQILLLILRLVHSSHHSSSWSPKRCTIKPTDFLTVIFCQALTKMEQSSHWHLRFNELCIELVDCVRIKDIPGAQRACREAMSLSSVDKWITNEKVGSSCRFSLFRLAYCPVATQGYFPERVADQFLNQVANDEQEPHSFRALAACFIVLGMKANDMNAHDALPYVRLAKTQLDKMTSSEREKHYAKSVDKQCIVESVGTCLDVLVKACLAVTKHAAKDDFRSKLPSTFEEVQQLRDAQTQQRCVDPTTTACILDRILKLITDAGIHDKWLAHEYYTRFDVYTLCYALLPILELNVLSQDRTRLEQAFLQPNNEPPSFQVVTCWMLCNIAMRNQNFDECERFCHHGLQQASLTSHDERQRRTFIQFCRLRIPGLDWKTKTIGDLLNFFVDKLTARLSQLGVHPSIQNDSVPRPLSLSQRLQEPGLVCDGCGMTREAAGMEVFHRCQRCQMQHYCSARCQRRKWKELGHRDACRDATQINVGDVMKLSNLVRQPEWNDKAVIVKQLNSSKPGYYIISIIGNHDKIFSVSGSNLQHIRPAF